MGNFRPSWKPTSDLLAPGPKPRIVTRTKKHVKQARWKSSVHEAGHAVMALGLGLDVAKVFVVDDVVDMDSMQDGGTLSELQRDSIRGLMASLMVSVSGAAAEEIILGHSLDASTVDGANIYHLLHELRQQLAMEWPDAPSPIDSEDIVRRLQARAKQLLNSNESCQAMHLVANQLMRSMEIVGNENLVRLIEPKVKPGTFAAALEPVIEECLLRRQA